jgi:hypothetical protein
MLLLCGGMSRIPERTKAIRVRRRASCHKISPRVGLFGKLDRSVRFEKEIILF